jgi:hypothetical protein
MFHVRFAMNARKAALLGSSSSPLASFRIRGTIQLSAYEFLSAQFEARRRHVLIEVKKKQAFIISAPPHFFAEDAFLQQLHVGRSEFTHLAGLRGRLDVAYPRGARPCWHREGGAMSACPIAASHWAISSWVTRKGRQSIARAVAGLVNNGDDTLVHMAPSAGWASKTSHV